LDFESSVCVITQFCVGTGKYVHRKHTYNSQAVDQNRWKTTQICSQKLISALTQVLITKL